MSRGVRIVAFAVLGSLLFAACSSSNSGGDNNTGGGTTASAAGSSSGTTGGSFDSAQCAQAAMAMGAAMAAVPSMMGGGSGDMQSSVDQLKAFADQAPDEIKDDMQTVAAGMDTFTQALKDSGYDPTSGQAPTSEQMAAIQAAGAALSDPAFKTASDNVSAWFKDNCGG